MRWSVEQRDRPPSPAAVSTSAPVTPLTSQQTHDYDSLLRSLLPMKSLLDHTIDAAALK